MTTLPLRTLTAALLLLGTASGQSVPLRTPPNRPIDVLHIDERDRPLSQEEVMLRVIGGQPSLFGPDFHQLTSRKRHAADDSDEEQEPT